MISPNSSAALQWQMQNIRGNLAEHADEAIAKARTKFDWRHYVSKHPWISLSAAAAMGYFLVPRRACRGGQNAEVIEEAVDRVARAVQPSPLAGVVAGMLSALSATIAREGVNLVVHSLKGLVEPQAGPLRSPNGMPDPRQSEPHY
jgi:hypothetical protein